jgi:hypothetical protein
MFIFSSIELQLLSYLFIHSHRKNIPFNCPTEREFFTVPSDSNPEEVTQ